MTTSSQDLTEWVWRGKENHYSVVVSFPSPDDKRFMVYLSEKDGVGGYKSKREDLDSMLLDESDLEKMIQSLTKAREYIRDAKRRGLFADPRPLKSPIFQRRFTLRLVKNDSDE